MKAKTLFIASLCSLISYAASSQNISWASGAGSSGSDQGYDISSDSSGHAYMSGWFSGDAQFSGQTLTSFGLQDIFIARYDSNGTLNWVKQAGGTGNEVCAGIVTNQQGDSYITGWYSGTSAFDDSTIVSSGSYDMFIAKYNAAGQLLWVKHGGGVSDDYGNRVALASDGGVTVAGSFRDTIHLEGQQLISNGNRDALICHYSSDGQLLWATGTGGTGEDRAYGIIQDADNNYFVTGLFTGIVNFGATQLSSNAIIATYVAKISSEGDFYWAKKGDGGANDFARGLGIKADHEGNAICNGFFSGTMNIGGTTLVATGGQYDFDAYLVKLNTNGDLLWAQKAGSNGLDQATALCITEDDEIIEVGFYQDTAHLGNLSLISKGKSDVFVAGYDPSGNAVWAATCGGTENDYGYGIVNDAHGNIYLTGVFGATATFGSYNLVSNGGNDVFITKISPFETGFGMIGASAAIKIFPNPAKDFLHIDATTLPGKNNSVNLQIFDGSGKSVLYKNDPASLSNLDISFLTPGIYLIKLSATDFSVCYKLIAE